MATRSVFPSSVCWCSDCPASTNPDSVAGRVDSVVAVAVAVGAVFAETVDPADRILNPAVDILDSVAAGSSGSVDSVAAVGTVDSVAGSLVAVAYAVQSPAYLPARYYHD